jgi:hypothetical protein
MLPQISDNDIDYGHLIASDYIKTGKIVDNCGNIRVEFLPDPCVPLTGEETCEDNPLLTKIKGSVEIECELIVDSIKIKNEDENGIDGCLIKNTDDTKVIGFRYDAEEEKILLIQKNSKICGEEEIPEEIFELPISEFDHNTVIEDFNFGLVDDNEDLLSIVDSDGRIFTVDMSKYSNLNDRYVAPGNYEATPEGLITLPYSTETDERVVIDISNAVHGFSNIDYDRCKGILTVTSDKGDVVSVEGLPTNVSLEGEVVSSNFTGSIRYRIENKVMTVNCDFTVNQLVGGLSYLGRLPIKLNRSVPVWLVSMHGTLYSRLNYIQLTIDTTGEILLRQWQIPEHVQDSFTIIIDGVDAELLEDICK